MATSCDGHEKHLRGNESLIYSHALYPKPLKDGHTEDPNSLSQASWRCKERKPRGHLNASPSTAVWIICPALVLGNLVLPWKVWWEDPSSTENLDIESAAPLDALGTCLSFDNPIHHLSFHPNGLKGIWKSEAKAPLAQSYSRLEFFFTLEGS